MPDEAKVPLFEHEHADEPMFLAGNMLEAARVHKNLPVLTVPHGCLLDFDGELVDFLNNTLEVPMLKMVVFHTGSTG